MDSNGPKFAWMLLELNERRLVPKQALRHSPALHPKYYPYEKTY